jgi:hypothetical protein
VFKQPEPQTEIKSTPASQKREKAESSAETLQAAHDLGNAVWPDPRWELSNSEAIEWGETTVALRDKFEVADTILGGGIFGRPIAKLLKIERHRAMEIIPAQGLMRKRTRRKPRPEENGAIPGDSIPLQGPSHEEWESMSEGDRQSTIQRFRAQYGGTGQPVAPPLVDMPPEGVPGR